MRSSRWLWIWKRSMLFKDRLKGQCSRQRKIKGGGQVRRKEGALGVAHPLFVCSIHLWTIPTAGGAEVLLSVLLKRLDLLLKPSSLLAQPVSLRLLERIPPGSQRFHHASFETRPLLLPFAHLATDHAVLCPESAQSAGTLDNPVLEQVAKLTHLARQALLSLGQTVKQLPNLLCSMLDSLHVRSQPVQPSVERVNLRARRGRVVRRLNGQSQTRGQLDETGAVFAQDRTRSTGGTSGSDGSFGSGQVVVRLG